MFLNISLFPLNSAKGNTRVGAKGRPKPNSPTGLSVAKIHYVVAPYRWSFMVMTRLLIV